ncbi:hypothetical protein GCM10007913_11620 [Devosia yakushimensis]|uniref:Uncharacterized protein n=1 Tax=Devosia yakushimensis TaxID=470028 RepID=A0ABQ5UBV9_9HYPH|nr:hypothetical protein [Devosia yakushimensis]GLQ09230.1 hypothetical protein GCM10007913_11620 [Devosia yakushimensis]
MSLNAAPPIKFSAPVLNAAGELSSLHERVDRLADRLSGAAPRNVARGTGDPIGEDAGEFDLVEGAGRHLLVTIQAIHEALDRIEQRLG